MGAPSLQPTSAPVTLPPQLRVYASFFLFSFTTGAMTSRLPDLQTKLGVTQGELGLMLIGMAIGSLVSLTFSAPLIERLGARTTALITLPATFACFGLVPWMPNAGAVFAVLFTAGLLAGAIEINLNVETDRLEALTGGHYMNRAHGSWSVGFFVAALLGFALLGLGASAVYPLAVSAAAQRTDRPAAVNVAALAQVTFVVFFLGPPLLGFVAQYANIRISYLVTVPVIVCGLIATRALPGRAPIVPAGDPAETTL